MTIEEMQAQLDAMQKALDERKAQLATRSATKRVGDLEWEHEVVVGLTHEEAVAHATQRGESRGRRDGDARDSNEGRRRTDAQASAQGPRGFAGVLQAGMHGTDAVRRAG